MSNVVILIQASLCAATPATPPPLTIILPTTKDYQLIGTHNSNQKSNRVTLLCMLKPSQRLDYQLS